MSPRKKTDIFWLLCAHAVQRHDATLKNPTAAIRRVADILCPKDHKRVALGLAESWPKYYGASRRAFVERLMTALGGRSLAEFASEHEHIHVEHDGRQFSMSVDGVRKLTDVLREVAQHYLEAADRLDGKDPE